jgi:hypothetical protein
LPRCSFSGGGSAGEIVIVSLCGSVANKIIINSGHLLAVYQGRQAGGRKSDLTHLPYDDLTNKERHKVRKIISKAAHLYYNDYL